MAVFYHGTTLESAIEICTKSINVKVGSKKSDFGQGFYITDNCDRAVTWAKRKAFLRNDVPAIVFVEFDIDAARPYIVEFEDDLRWGQFIINNRNGYEYIAKIPFQEHNIDSKYHITHGRISDINVFNLARTLKNKGIMLNDLNSMLNINFPMQYAFHTAFSLRFIKKLTYRRLVKEVPDGAGIRTTKKTIY